MGCMQVEVHRLLVERTCPRDCAAYERQRAALADWIGQEFVQPELSLVPGAIHTPMRKVHDYGSFGLHGLGCTSVFESVMNTF